MKNEHKSYNNIDISGELDMPRIIHLMKLGLFFAVVALIADILIGYGATDSEIYGIPAAVARFLNVSDGRIFWSALLGLIGIPVECLCYFSIYRLIFPASKKYAHRYRSGIFGCLILGAGVHVLCCALAYFMKKISICEQGNLLQESLKFAGYFLLPATVLFLIFFAVLIASQIGAFGKGLTPLPKWAWIFSPLFGVAAAIVLKLPDLPLTNALASGWINLGNLWTFGGLLVLTKKCNVKGR